MKKKITAIFLCIALAATAIVGASLAYFTDTDSAKNTFTVGNVKIDLQEGTKKTGNETAANLTDWATTYPNGAELMPGSSSVNNVSKIITVKNTGTNAAWVWVDLKIPAALLDAPFKVVGQPDWKATTQSDTYNSLHINEYGAFIDYYYTNDEDFKTMTADSSPVKDGILNVGGSVVNNDMVNWEANNLWHGFKVIAVDEDYVTLRSYMLSTLPSGKISLPCLRQVYMDWRVTGTEVTNNDGTTTYQYTLTDGTVYNGSWEIIVNAYAIQDAGFSNVEAAIAAYNANGSKTNNPGPKA